jgi:hypothetical protein
VRERDGKKKSFKDMYIKNFHVSKRQMKSNIKIKKKKRNNFSTKMSFADLFIAGTKQGVQPVVDVAVIVETVDVEHWATAQNS